MSKENPCFTYEVKKGDPGRMGVCWDGRQVNVSVAVPTGKSCSLLLYRKGQREAEASIPLGSGTGFGEVRSVSIEDLPANAYEYTFRIDGIEMTDPYTKAFVAFDSAGEEYTVPRSRILLESREWKKDQRPQLPLEDCVLYATHVRGFTMDASSGVRKKGTFQGIEEKIPHLKQLGINQLELMPVYEPKNESGTSDYWGYGPGFYFAPRASYGATDDPVEELKHLVSVLHENGIELILEFYFPAETNPGMVLECIRYWAMEYHMDGVHLNDGKPFLELLEQDPLLAHIKIYGEDEVSNRVKAHRYRATYEAEFQRTARSLLRGQEGQIQAFAELTRKHPQGGSMIRSITSHNGFTLRDLVSYEEKHNEANGEENRDGADWNYSWNCGEEGPSKSLKIEHLRLRQMKNALAMVFFSQGIPMIYGGDECGNSQQGNNNAYCQDNELGWINWENGSLGKKMQDYVIRLSDFRRRYPVFRQKNPLRCSDYLGIGMPDLSYHGKSAWYGEFEPSSRRIGMLYTSDYVTADSGETKAEDYVYVIYNFHGSPKEFALPVLPGKRNWYLVLDTGREESGGFYEEGKEILIEERKTMVVEAYTILVLSGRMCDTNDPALCEAQERRV